MNKYPCECSGMCWMIDNNKVFKDEEGKWMLTWIELDRSRGGINIENFGIQIKYCVFCGEKINN